MPSRCQSLLGCLLHLQCLGLDAFDGLASLSSPRPASRPLRPKARGGVRLFAAIAGANRTSRVPTIADARPFINNLQIQHDAHHRLKHLRGTHICPCQRHRSEPERNKLRLEAIRYLAAALGELGHNLFVQPGVHFRRAVESAGISELLRQLFASTETTVQF